jgi:hypothetical protein
MKALPVALAALIALVNPAQAEMRTLDLGAFTEIDIGNGIEAEITVGGEQSITAEGLDPTDLESLRTEVRDGKLWAWLDWNIFDLFNLEGRQTRLTITVPALTSVGANTGSEVKVTGVAGDAVYIGASKGAIIEAVAVAGKKFVIEAYEGAEVSVSGTCESATMNASAGAELDAQGLQCESAFVSGDSGASLKIFASASLTAHAEAGSSIEVHGAPATVEEHESSGGSIDIE